MFAAQWLVACALAGAGEVVLEVVAEPVPPAAAPAAGAAVAPGAPAGAKVAPAVKQPTDTVLSIHDERIEGAVDGFDGGLLTIATQPPRKLALDQIERIEFVRKTVETMSIIWIGQDNRDLAPANSGTGPNGIQDIHLQCRGLPIGKRVQQFFVFAPRAGGESHVWANLGTTAFWHVESEQTPGKAEIYIEPPPADCFGQEWEVWITLDDSQILRTTVRATTHTDSKLKVGTAVAPQPPAETSPVAANVMLEGDDTLRGEIVALDEDSLTLKTASIDAIKIPLVQVRGCWLGAAQPEQLAAQLEKRGDTDWVLFKTRENTPTTVDGALKGLADGKLELTVSGESRKVAADRLLGFVLAARPPQPRPASFYQAFEWRDGQRISGRLAVVKPDAIEFRTLWDSMVRVPRPELQSVTCHNGKVTYLSDLEPASVDEAPYFGQSRPFQRDHNLQGAALTVKGTSYRKGLAVHSRSVLGYALEGRYAMFQTTVGFDDAAPAGGSVVCRVLADGRELYVNPTLRQSGDPVPLKLSVEGVKQLVLEIDFGEGEDIGDRVIWAGARLFHEKWAAADNPAPKGN